MLYGYFNRGLILSLPQQGQRSGQSSSIILAALATRTTYI